MSEVEIVPSERNTPGNAAALREAVVALLDALDSLGCDEETATLAAFVPDMADSSAKCLAAFRKAKSALAAPPRNCDVGAPEEQAERFRNFCKMDYISEDCPDDCPLYRKDCSTIRCPFAWAQTPYKEEGGAK